MDLWKEIKEKVGLGLGDISDAAFAKIILDRLVIYNLSASVIFILSRISKRITSGICYAENPRRFYVLFLQCRRCRCDGWGNPWRHGHRPIAWAVGCVPALLSWYPPRNAVCYHSTSSLFSLKKLLLTFHTIIQISY